MLKLPKILILTSLAFEFCNLSAIAQNNPPIVMNVAPTGVNLQDGSYFYTTKDISIGSLNLERVYLGGPAIAERAFGGNWSHNYNSQIILRTIPFSGQTTTVVVGLKTFIFIGGASSTTYYPGNGYEGIILERISSIYNLTERDGTKFVFGATGNRLSEIIYTSGYKIDLYYSSSQIRLIKNNMGHAIVLNYNGDNSIISACAFNLAETPVSISTSCSSSSIKTSYSYSALGVKPLTSITDVFGNTSSVVNSHEGVKCVTSFGTGICKEENTYIVGHPFQVSSQLLADGTTWNFFTDAGFADRTGDQDPFTPTSAQSTNPAGGEYVVTYLNGVPDSFSNELGAVTDVGYYGPIYGGATLPEGNKIQYLHSPRMAPAGIKLTPKGGSGTPIASSKSYPASCTNRVTCNRPDTETDANGNVTSYTYDGTHGGVLTKTDPAVGGIAPVTRYSYAQRNAWIKNAAGTAYVQAVPAIWLMTEERTCKTSATVGNACQAGSSDEVVTTYDYGPNSGPNNLMLRGTVVDSGGLSLRTCYQYDSQGNKIAETKPRAGLTSCP